MYLKRIEIFGFKSFAQNSVLDFDYKKTGNITAVVGPNGSGKSNVADAIRWVTGEQSGKNIRSKKSEDLIFCGSSAKPRGSYSEVSIILADEKPVKFELAGKEHELLEVEISRKLYRSGDSEYLINHKKVRLTDIQQVLASLGFGQASYTVIGQGMVDRLLFFTPSERKILFDEAAGVKQYEIKREQAIRKLESTDSNLIRLTDILGELEPRVANLRRLVKRAEGRKGTEGELREIQQHYYGSLYGEYKSTVDESEQARKDLNTKIVQIEDKISAIQKKIEVGRDNPHTQKKREIEHDITEFTRERDALMQEVSYIKGRLESLESNHNNIQEKLQQLREDKARYSEKAEFLTAKISTEESEVATIEVDFQKLDKQLALSDKEIGALDEALANPTGQDLKKATEIAGSLEELEQRRQQTAGELFATRQQENYVKSQQEEIVRRIREVEVDITNTRKKFTDMESVIKNIEAYSNANKSKRDINYKKLKSALSELEKLEGELTKLTEKIDPKSLSLLEVELKDLNKSRGVILSNFEKVNDLKQLESAKNELKIFGINIGKLFDKFLGVTKAVNPSEREKLETSLRNMRDEIKALSDESTRLEITAAKLDSELGSNKEYLEELHLRIGVKETELKALEKQVDTKVKSSNVDTLELSLQKINKDIALLQQEEKRFSGAVSDHQNTILKQKNLLQAGAADIRQQMHRLELDISMKSSVIVNQKVELSQSRESLAEISKSLEILEKQPVTAADKEIGDKLKLFQKDLSKSEEKLAKERGALLQTMDMEKEFEQSSYTLEREMRDLQESRNNVSKELSHLEIELAKTTVRLEDLTEEIKNMGIELLKQNKFEILDQMEKDVLKLRVENLKRKLDVTVGIDPETEAEYRELESRSTEMASQIIDLTKAKEDLEKVIKELDGKIKNQFSEVFKNIAKEFDRYFNLLFDGGSANLSLGEDEEGGFGIEIAANPPGKRIQSLHALSGGERTLTSLALLFAILSINPSPFIMLDEVDAALDESNTNRFLKILDDLAKKTQFIIITHNRDTMKSASSLYGVTMSDEHISKLISVKLTEAIAVTK